MNPTTLPSAGVLVLRVIVGVAFVLHGLDKLGDLSSAGAGRFSLDASLELPQRFLQRVRAVIGAPRST